MFETLKRLYNSGKLNDDGLQNAIERKWITAEQTEEIKQNK